MWFYEVAPTKIVRAGSSVFTYHANRELAVGQLVQIPVGKQTLNGLVMRAVSQPDYPTKAIASIIEETALPLPREL